MAAPPLEDRVRAHSDFFDKLVELIPARYYVPDEQNPEWNKFNKTKSAKALAKLEAKENSKKALRAKLQPGAQSTLEKIKSKARGDSGAAGDDASASDASEDASEDEPNESDFEDDVSDEENESQDASDASDEEDDEDEAPAAGPKPPATPAGAPPTANGWSVDSAGGNRLEELRERLQAKIAASRVARKAEESQEKAAKAKEWREEKKKAKAERKRKEKADAKASARANGADDAKKKRSRDADSDDSESDDDASNLQFGRVEVEGKVGGPAKKKRASKEALLKKALAQRREIEDAGGEDTAAGKKVAERYSWDAALARAGGEKVLDDPKLLQKSVKNEQRMKKKSAEKWAARVDRTEEQMAAKQKKRKDSLKSRANAKVEKRIEKREKKRNRPGFEGRSQAPINA